MLPLRAILSGCLLAAACLAGMPLPRAANAQPPGVRLTAANDAAIRFEVSVPAARFEGSPGAEGAAAGTRLVLEGYESAGPASPAALARIVVLAVPPLGEVRVSGTGGEAEIREGFLPAQEPGASEDGRDRMDGRTRSGPEAQPGPRARLLEVGWMRNQRIARIAVYPVEYDAGARRLTLYRSVEVAVQVEPVGDLGGPAESPDPFEGAYRGALLNYEQGRAWRRPATARLLQRAGQEPARLAAFAPVVPETSVYVGRTWIKIAVQRPGFYKVDYGRLQTMSLFSQDTRRIPLESLRLFNWPGFPVLPTTSYCDSCDFREVAITVVDDGDGSFRSNADYFYFFAMGPSDWASLYDPALPETVFINHPYETNNYYYLTRSTDESPVAGTQPQIATVDGRITNPALPVPATFPARAHFEQDNEYYPDASPLYSTNQSEHPGLFWEKWFWRSLTQGGTFQVPVDLPGADPAQPVRLRALAWGLNYNTQFGSLKDHYLDVSFNGAAFPTRAFNDLLAQVFDTTLTNLRTAGNLFTIGVQNLTDPLNRDRVDRCGLAWFDLYYQRAFRPLGDRLDFDSREGGAGEVIYRIGPFTGSTLPFIFDVTDASRPVQIVVPLDTVHFASRPDGYYLSFQVSETSRRRYRVVPGDSITSEPGENLLEAPLTSLVNLRSRTERADYIVIYYDRFQAAADSLVTWRRERLPLQGAAGPFEASAVPISALYDQFSGGRTDPAAIRNFLRAAFCNWNGGGDPRRPAYVTFLGDASYDYKNILGRAGAGQPGVLVPTYEDNFHDAFVVRKQFTTDDWLLNVDDASQILPDFFGGRIPVDDPATALAVVRTKVLDYERYAPLGPWRNRIMLIADDDKKGTVPDLGLLWEHLRQTTQLDTLFTPQHLERDYVYLHTYPDGPGASKPGAKAAIRDGVNEGVAVMNYVGHGSPFQLADERVLLDTDVGSLTNAPRFTVFISASCDVGKFSDPTIQSLGERLVTSTVGGAVGVISATELAFSSSNATLNQTIYRELFRRDAEDCQYHTPLAQALLAAKTGYANEQKYQLLGDAAIGVSLPRLWVDLTLADSAGGPVSEVRRGQTLAYTGRVRTCPGGEAVPFNGVAGVLIEDSQEIGFARVRGVYQGQSYADSTYYYLRGGAMYRGDVGVTDGGFQGRFVVPMEAREGPRGRVMAYVEGRSVTESSDTDGAGSVPARVSPGTAPVGDVSGPRIVLSFVGEATTVRPDAVLKVDLYDPSGVLTTDHTPQNGIIVTIDGNTTTRADITESFRCAANSYQSGTARFQLPNLPAGAHTVSVSAADNLATGLSAAEHRSRVSLDFTVVDQPVLRIAHAYLFPNPAESASGRAGGQFVIDAPGDSVNVLLRIYTASGRLIRTLTVFGGLGQIQMPWDGLDDEGQPLANGVYFFRVHVNPRDPDGKSSPRAKADADGRFVIVNPK